VPENLEYIDFAGEDIKEKSLIRNIKVALYNNLAACYLKANDFHNAKFACDEALLLDSNQTKAL
jgi:Flp pilus assembly protein TadD